MKHSLLDLFGDLAGASPREFDRGEPVFRQGDPARWFRAVLEGQVKLERVTPEGGTILLQTAHEGESFAEAALFGGSYGCNATASVRSRVLLVPGEAVLSHLRSDAAVAERVISVLAPQVRDLRARLEMRNILSARDRIIHYLLVSASGGGEVFLRNSLMDLAAELGLAHETLYRELAALEREGFLTREGSCLRLLNPHPGD